MVLGLAAMACVPLEHHRSVFRQRRANPNDEIRPHHRRPNNDLLDFVILDQIGGGFLSQLRMAMRVNPQSSSMRSLSFCSGGDQPK